MGLDLSVGYLADLAAHDPESVAEVSGEFENLSLALEAVGLAPHDEPREATFDGQFSCQMWGYSGLHCLRRVAAWLAFGRGLPEPGTDAAAEDPLLTRYYDRVAKPPGLLARLFQRTPQPLPFQHLMVHGDADPLVPVSVVKQAARTMPDASLCRMQAGHWPMRECPDEFNRRVIAFLNG